MPGRLIQPNTLNVEARFMPGPNAFPATATLNNGQQAMLLSAGGLSKLEYVAALLFANNHEKLSGHRAVLAAKELLDACEEAQTPPPQEETNGSPQ